MYRIPHLELQLIVFVEFFVQNEENSKILNAGKY